MKELSSSTKTFVDKLTAIVKAKYKQSIWGLVGFLLLCVAGLAVVILLTSLAFQYLYQKAILLYYAAVYGMSGAVTTTSILIGLGLFLLGIIATILVLFCVSLIGVAIQFHFQDAVKGPDQQVSFSGIWNQFKKNNNNQVLRLTLWMALFIFLWTLPVEIIGAFFSANNTLVILFRIAVDLVVLWKGLEYSQAYFLYRENRPKFLGQSMRHAVTASRRFMSKSKLNFLLLSIVTIVPLLAWSLVWYLVAYYGDYTATYFFLYAGEVIGVIGACAYLPVIYLMLPLYYETKKADVNIDKIFEKTLKPSEYLTGEEQV